MLLNFYFILFIVLIFNLNKIQHKLIYVLTNTILYFNLIFFKKLTFYKNNYHENEYWYLVEMLNNNNKSIILFLLILFFFLISINKYFNTFLQIFNKIFFIFFIFFIFIFNFKGSFIKYFFYNFVNNTTLINGVILIHPLLIYYTYGFLIITILYNVNLIYYNSVIKHLYKNKTTIFIVSFLGLFLGSFWAQQEMNWGGWWNWDYVEIVALIFNVLTLYIIHTNFIKHLNDFYIICRNILYYLICFFLFVRVDILNSIHSFNSINISTNYRSLILVFILYFSFYIINFFYKYYFKYNLNFKFGLITLLFKCINTIFFFYFFINLFIIFYFNFQFIDFTKFLKYFLTAILYVFIIIVMFNFSSNNLLVIFACTIIFIQFYCSIISFFFLINLIYFFIRQFNITKLYLYKKINFNKYLFVKMYLVHFMFLIFMFLIKYDCYTQFGAFFKKLNFSFFILNNDYIHTHTTINQVLNSNSFINIILNNYFYNVNYFNPFQLKCIYTNNIIFNDNCYIIYNIDNIVNYLFYSIHLFLLLLIWLIIILVIV